MDSYRTVTGAEWDVRECYQCLTDPEYCVDYHFITAFGDDQATVSADGDTISGHFQDPGSKAGWTYRFVRPKP